MKKHSLLFCLTITIYSQSTLSLQKENQITDTTISKYYQSEKEKGWFWYDDPLPDVKRLITEERLNTLPDKEKNKNEPKKLSVAWIRVNYQRYLDAALDNPENKLAMTNYLYLEKYIRDRATMFGYARQSAVFSDPNLDAVTTRPTANFAMKTMNNIASKNKNNLISKIAEQAGIFFFYRSNCQFCHQQAPIIALLAKEYGFSVTAVSLDGKPLLNTEWENNFLTDNGQAEKLKVLRVPALYLVTKNNKVSVIVQGIEAYPMIKTRIIDAAKRTGLINEKTQALTRPSNLYQDLDGKLAGKINKANILNSLGGSGK